MAEILTDSERKRMTINVLWMKLAERRGREKRLKVVLKLFDYQ